MFELITYLFFYTGIALASEQHHERALPLLTRINHRMINQVEWLHFWKAVVYHQSMQYDKAKKEIDSAENGFRPLPLRYQALLDIMSNDIAQWSEGMEDIHRRMRRVARQLDNFEDIKGAQRQQKEIIDELDKLIKKKEDKAQSQADAAAQAAKGKLQPKLNPSRPQDDSIPGEERGPGIIDQKVLKHYQEIWGQMNEKERARAIQQLTRDVPTRFKFIIEDYFKNLNR